MAKPGVKVTYDASGILDKADEIIKAGKGVANSANELLTGEFSIHEVYDVLVSLVRAVEEVITDTGVGEIKHALVIQIFHELDKQYEIVDVIDKAIPAPWILELIDGYVIRKFIDLFIILIVNALNVTGVFK